jgi:metal-dependent hydrolase (beta-lactamase superfamily II)
MGLMSGTKLGPYEIVSPLGAGGMGEVYRARDTRLGRDVAIKVLPAHLSSNPDLKQRLEREAKAISSLNHPHICTLHDVGSQDGAALVEYGGKRILFDSGNNPEVLAQNAKAKNIDLSKLDFVVMSHRHGDHMGGLAYLLKVNPKVKIYAPKEGFGVYGADLPSSFYRKDPSLPSEQRYYGSTPPDVLRFGSAWPGANFQLVDKTAEIASDIHLISLISDKPGSLELHELSLAINTPDGMVLVVGCSHPGIDKIVEAASAINPRII